GWGSKLRRFALLIIWLLLAACGADAEPEIALLPTSEATATQFTRTPTLMPTIIIPPTITLAPTSTPVPISAGGPTPTSPLHPTFTPAPATETATRLPTQIGLEIEYFITNTSDPASSETLTLFWRINGADSGRIFRLNAEDRRVQVWEVPAEGRLTISTRTEDTPPDAARFLLLAEVNGSVVEEILEIPLGCPFVWFFLPAPPSCPASPPTPTFQVEQRFEGGIMVWLESRDEILVIFNDGETPAWIWVPDNFEEGMTERDDSLSPPPDRSQPVRGFGLAWREEPQVRDRLGWATEPEIGYDGIIQAASGGTENEVTYLRLRDGGILTLEAGGENWAVLPFGEITPPAPEISTPTPAESEQSS
ncbi:MAG: hypothetical protein K8I82_07310, partial [Anaerolineae bacterium]|nr:hypothetical protein [Anaerolineae bacterium]